MGVCQALFIIFRSRIEYSRIIVSGSSDTHNFVDAILTRARDELQKDRCGLLVIFIGFVLGGPRALAARKRGWEWWWRCGRARVYEYYIRLWDGW